CPQMSTLFPYTTLFRSRAILAGLTVEQINNDMQGFNERVRKVAQTQLERMGFEITSLNLSDLWDEEGYLDNLGRPQAAKVKEIRSEEHTSELQSRFDLV